MSIHMAPEGRRLLEERRTSELPSSEQLYRIAEGSGCDTTPVRRRLKARGQVSTFVSGIALLILIGLGGGGLVALAKGIWP